MTWADILMSYVLYSFGDKHKDLLDIETWKGNCPNLVNLIKTVGNQPNIKKWIDTRPNTER